MTCIVLIVGLVIILAFRNIILFFFGLFIVLFGLFTGSEFMNLIYRRLLVSISRLLVLVFSDILIIVIFSCFLLCSIDLVLFIIFSISCSFILCLFRSCAYRNTSSIVLHVFIFRISTFISLIFTIGFVTILTFSLIFLLFSFTVIHRI